MDVEELHVVGMQPTGQLYTGSYCAVSKSSLASFEDAFVKSGRNAFHGHPLRKLSLRDAHMTSLPAQLCLFRGLVSLDVSHNDLRSFSVAHLESLPSLRCLNLACNQIALLPPVLFRLTALEQLDVSDNPTLQFPGGKHSLDALVSSLLRLRELHLKQAPGKVWSAESLQQLRQLAASVGGRTPSRPDLHVTGLPEPPPAGTAAPRNRAVLHCQSLPAAQHCPPARPQGDVQMEGRRAGQKHAMQPGLVREGQNRVSRPLCVRRPSRR
eukprot:jgi/Botrbrau1/4579/Bobra.60_2s0065.1